MGSVEAECDGATCQLRVTSASPARDPWSQLIDGTPTQARRGAGVPRIADAVQRAASTDVVVSTPIDTPGGTCRIAAMIAEFARWPMRKWVVALGGAVATALLVGLPTDVIPNPVFGRPVPVTWWSYPVLVVTAVLGGLLLATYVRGVDVEVDRPARFGGIGGALSFFAVGCPVCNKVVVIALGTVGARQWFEPIQPLLAAASVVLMAVALRARLRNADRCALPQSRQAIPADTNSLIDHSLIDHSLIDHS